MSNHDDTFEFEKFGFGGSQPTPCRSSAMALAQMLITPLSPVEMLAATLEGDDT